MNLPVSNPARKGKRIRKLSRANQRPRTEARQSKLRSLTPVQIQSLLRWFDKDKVTYVVARERLLKQFGISLSICSLSEFWHRHHAPQPPASPDSEVLIELVIHSGRPVRLIVKEKNGETSLKT